MSQAYVGSELSLFAGARNWKAYLAVLLRPWLGRRVLDVGAGIGGNISHLFSDAVKEWIALEPDPDLARQINGASRVLVGTLTTLAETERFNTILYLDVLEHIEDDAGELARATRHLEPNGRLIVLVPAHQGLYSPFDAAIGHFRRYSRRSLRRIGPLNSRLDQLLTLDSVGLFALLANRIALRSAMPTPAQVQLWDRTMIPLSKVVDRLTCYRIGKTLLAIWSVG